MTGWFEVDTTPPVRANVTTPAALLLAKLWSVICFGSSVEARTVSEKVSVSVPAFMFSAKLDNTGGVESGVKVDACNALAAEIAVTALPAISETLEPLIYKFVVIFDVAIKPRPLIELESDVESCICTTVGEGFVATSTPS